MYKAVNSWYCGEVEGGWGVDSYIFEKTNVYHFYLGRRKCVWSSMIFKNLEFCTFKKADFICFISQIYVIKNCQNEYIIAIFNTHVTGLPLFFKYQIPDFLKVVGPKFQFFFKFFVPNSRYFHTNFSYKNLEMC